MKNKSLTMPPRVFAIICAACVIWLTCGCATNSRWEPITNKTNNSELYYRFLGKNWLNEIVNIEIKMQAENTDGKPTKSKVAIDCKKWTVQLDSFMPEPIKADQNVISEIAMKYCD